MKNFGKLFEKKQRLGKIFELRGFARSGAAAIVKSLNMKYICVGCKEKGKMKENFTMFSKKEVIIKEIS